MNVHVLACDYDGTIADHGVVADATTSALARVRESGRKLLLVTGRMMPDLRSVCPALDDMFDAVVAENGALLHLPATREDRVLGQAPEPALLEALARRQVPVERGAGMVATLAPFAEAARAAIREAGVDRTLIFNKGALMLLPAGVTKGSGLQVALRAIERSPHNTVCIGDAENDHDFLALAECAVAVADAVPELRERADYVTRAPGGGGVVEFIEDHLLGDLAELIPRLSRHDLVLGNAPDGSAVTLPAHDTRLLVVGPSATGKATLTGTLVARVVEAGRSVVVIDAAGDQDLLADMQDVLVLGGGRARTLPGPDELRRLVHHPRLGLALDLSSLPSADKVAYATQALATLTTERATCGLPHWLVIGAAHRLMPTAGSPTAALLQTSPGSLVLVARTADDLPVGARPLANVVASTDLAALTCGLQAMQAPAPLPADGPPLRRGEAVLAGRGDGPPRRFTIGRRRPPPAS